MAHNPGDDKTEPTLELPSLKLPGLRRRKKQEQKQDQEQPEPGSPPVEDTTPPDVPVGEPEPEPEAPATTPGPTQEPEPTTTLEPAPAAPPAAAPAQEPAQEPVPAPAQKPARRRSERSLPNLTAPSIPGRLAALLTGLLVGLAGAAGTYAAMEGCEAVRGVSTCGEGPGFFILVAIFVLMVLLGGVLLKALRVGDATSTSFLGVGIVTVVVMVTLLEQIYSPWMFVVVPVVSGLAYVLSHWVTTRFAHEDTGRRDWT